MSTLYHIGGKTINVSIMLITVSILVNKIKTTFYWSLRWSLDQNSSEIVVKYIQFYIYIIYIEFLITRVSYYIHYW